MEGELGSGLGDCLVLVEEMRRETISDSLRMEIVGTRQMLCTIRLEEHWKGRQLWHLLRG